MERNLKVFLFSGIAGSTGAFCVFPIDLVKTRMQNQISNLKIPKQQLYKNSFDCFKTIFRNEGLLGFYRGATPNIVGVFPEKAIKITINNYLNHILRDKNGVVPFASQLLAGALAGMGQVIVTNPMEIIKIQMQMQHLTKLNNKNLINVIRNIGIKNLYKGASACFMRDIPFSLIYFPLYTFIKSNNPNSFSNYLLPGMISGAISAYTVTPFDVIKTRLQTKRVDNIKYNGLYDCFIKVYKTEGLSAFFKGEHFSYIKLLRCASDPNTFPKLDADNKLYRNLYHSGVRCSG